MTAFLENMIKWGCSFTPLERLNSNESKQNISWVDPASSFRHQYKRIRRLKRFSSVTGFVTVSVSILKNSPVRKL